MLHTLMHVLNTQRIVLASGSPRRKQILENIGLKFEVIPSTFEETLEKAKFEQPYDYVKETARRKVMDVAIGLARDQNPPDLIIGADTVVAMDKKIYEKPSSEENAFEILSRFSGRSHTVYTGVVLARPKSGNADLLMVEEGYQVTLFHEATEVFMSELSPAIIRAYVSTGEPMDKAGGYGIQDIGGTLVEGIHGDYFNVMGFPLHKFSKQLLQFYGQNV